MAANKNFLEFKGGKMVPRLVDQGRYHRLNDIGHRYRAMISSTPAIPKMRDNRRFSISTHRTSH
jgi:hypothetical protein